MEHRKLLIIDAKDEDRAALRCHLEKDPHCSYTFLEEGLIASALVSYRRERPDCIVLDHQLPDGTSFEFLDLIRDGKGRVPLPVVILTGNGTQDLAVKLMHGGAHDYLVKSDTEAEAVRLAVSNAIYKVKAQQQLEQQREELDRLHAETRKQNLELQAAKLALETASTAKDDFLSMLSHELRTPLTPVLSIVSATLQDGNFTPDLRETFRLIQRNIEIEARLIDDLLDINRALGGRLEIQKSPLDVHCCIQAAIDLCQPAFDEKKIALHTAFEAPASMVAGDFARLQQVFWNLLKNAAEFTPGGGLVDIVTRDAAGKLIVEVRDSGVGIPVERIAEIFAAFEKCSSNHRFGSLGLGLSIARSLTEAHEGTLVAFSEGSNRGALFTMTLPLISPAPIPRTEASEAARGRTVLVVEDHEDTRRALSRALRRRGYGVTAAANVEAACEQFALQPADLLICDIGLPDGTGWDVIKRLLERGPVRAIAVSGYGAEGDVQRSTEAGFAAHITKPVDFPKLESLIASVLSKAA